MLLRDKMKMRIQVTTKTNIEILTQKANKLKKRAKYLQDNKQNNKKDSVGLSLL